MTLLLFLVGAIASMVVAYMHETLVNRSKRIERWGSRVVALRERARRSDSARAAWTLVLAIWFIAFSLLCLMKAL